MMKAQYPAYPAADVLGLSIAANGTTCLGTKAQLAANAEFKVQSSSGNKCCLLNRNNKTSPIARGGRFIYGNNFALILLPCS